MSDATHAGFLMTSTFDIEALIEEIERYLAAVDVFRQAGCRLAWRRERRTATLTS